MQPVLNQILHARVYEVCICFVYLSVLLYAMTEAAVSSLSSVVWICGTQRLFYCFARVTEAFQMINCLDMNSGNTAVEVFCMAMVLQSFELFANESFKRITLAPFCQLHKRCTSIN